MGYVQKTLNAAATTGYVVELGQKCGKVSILSIGTANVKVGSGTVPSTPTSAYVAGSGETKDAIDLLANGEVTFGVDSDGKGYISGVQDPIEWVAVWAVGGGKIKIVGH